MVSSTDGYLTVPKTVKIARKPGQRIRIKHWTNRELSYKHWTRIELERYLKLEGQSQSFHASEECPICQSRHKHAWSDLQTRLFFINIMPHRDSNSIVNWFIQSCISPGVLTFSRVLPGIPGRPRALWAVFSRTNLQLSGISSLKFKNLQILIAF
jgi:hypothetical protein